MATTDLPRHSLTTCQVIGHRHYGLIVRSSDDRDGFIDSSDLSDGPVAPTEWPAIGDNLDVVVLGHTREGRVRLSARPRDVALIRSVSDPARAFEVWKSLKDAPPDNRAAVDAFLGHPDARYLLRWGASHRAGTPQYVLAMRILAEVPVSEREQPH